MSRNNFTGPNLIAKMRDEEIKISADQLTKFRDMFVRDDDLSNRMTKLLWFDLYILCEKFGVSPPEILLSIEDVENGEVSGRGIKPATQFTRDPLKGFWHKHYFSAHFLATNMILGLGEGGVAKIVEEVMNTGEPRVTEEMIRTLAHRVTNDPIEDRDAKKKLTGEWIVFAKHSGKNYYLCANTHEAGDDFIHDRIQTFCTIDFPDVMTWR